MRLVEIMLTTVDLDAMRRFYCGVLGLREMEPHWTGRLTVQVGDSYLVFYPSPVIQHARYHFAIDVPSQRFDLAQAWLHERGGPITDTDGTVRFNHEHWNAEAIYFSDPQGNILELIARHDKTPEMAKIPAGDIPLRADRPFTGSELLGITEIGIAADSVVDLVAILQTHIPGLPIYDGIGSDQFTAVGDINGLLIVARRGRIWFPNTGVPADHYPLEILLELEKGRRYRLAAPPYPISIQPES